MIVPALIMLPREIRGTSSESQLEAADGDSEPEEPPDH